MNKNKFFTAVITIAIAVAALIIIVNLIFNRGTKINQGKFRISDTLLTSVVTLEDKSEEGIEWKFDVSQNNKISMLIQANQESFLKEAYLEKIKVKSKNDVNIYIEQEKYDVSYKYKDVKNKKVNIYTEETEDGNYLIEFDVNNQDVISSFSVPEDVKEIRHDGTILNTAKISVSEIAFEIRYNLVVVEQKGQVSKCKIKLKMPDKKIITEGFVVQRLNSTDFNFKVDY